MSSELAALAVNISPIIVVVAYFFKRSLHRGSPPTAITSGDPQNHHRALTRSCNQFLNAYPIDPSSASPSLVLPR